MPETIKPLTQHKASSAAAPLAFITGASSGLGEALTRAYLGQGWRVALVARRLAPLQQLQAQVAAQDPDAAKRMLLLAADVQDEAAIVQAAEQCLQHHGVPDVVIANAGISVGMDTAEREDLAVMRDTLAINNLGMAATFHPFVKPMRARGQGRLVGVASVAAIRGLPGHGAYCASKAGVVAYCESLRGELRGSGVQVVTIVPGYVATPLTANNRYPMPFLMQPQAFAERAVRAIQAGDSYRVIPWQMGWVAKVLRLLPNAVFDAAFAGRGRKQRRPSGAGE